MQKMQMLNGKYQCHKEASCTYHLPSPSCSTRAMQKNKKIKNPTLNAKCLRIFRKSQDNGPLAKNETKQIRQKEQEG